MFMKYFSFSIIYLLVIFYLFNSSYQIREYFDNTSDSDSSQPLPGTKQFPQICNNSNKCEGVGWTKNTSGQYNATACCVQNKTQACKVGDPNACPMIPMDGTKEQSGSVACVPNGEPIPADNWFGNQTITNWTPENGCVPCKIKGWYWDKHAYDYCSQWSAGQKSTPGFCGCVSNIQPDDLVFPNPATLSPSTPPSRRRPPASKGPGRQSAPLFNAGQLSTYKNWVTDLYKRGQSGKGVPISFMIDTIYGDKKPQPIPSQPGSPPSGARSSGSPPSGARSSGSPPTQPHKPTSFQTSDVKDQDLALGNSLFFENLGLSYTYDENGNMREVWNPPIGGAADVCKAFYLPYDEVKNNKGEVIDFKWHPVSEPGPLVPYKIDDSTSMCGCPTTEDGKQQYLGFTELGVDWWDVRNTCKTGHDLCLTKITSGTDSVGKAIDTKDTNMKLAEANGTELEYNSDTKTCSIKCIDGFTKGHDTIEIGNTLFKKCEPNPKTTKKDQKKCTVNSAFLNTDAQKQAWQDSNVNQGLDFANGHPNDSSQPSSADLATATSALIGNNVAESPEQDKTITGYQPYGATLGDPCPIGQYCQGSAEAGGTASFGDPGVCVDKILPGFRCTARNATGQPGSMVAAGCAGGTYGHPNMYGLGACGITGPGNPLTDENIIEKRCCTDTIKIVSPGDDNNCADTEYCSPDDIDADGKCKSGDNRCAVFGPPEVDTFGICHNQQAGAYCKLDQDWTGGIQWHNLFGGKGKISPCGDGLQCSNPPNILEPADGPAGGVPGMGVCKCIDDSACWGTNGILDADGHGRAGTGYCNLDTGMCEAAKQIGETCHYTRPSGADSDDVPAPSKECASGWCAQGYCVNGNDTFLTPAWDAGQYNIDSLAVPSQRWTKEFSHPTHHNPYFCTDNTQCASKNCIKNTIGGLTNQRCDPPGPNGAWVDSDNSIPVPGKNYGPGANLYTNIGCASGYAANGLVRDQLDRFGSEFHFCVPALGTGKYNDAEQAGDKGLVPGEAGSADFCTADDQCSGEGGGYCTSPYGTGGDYFVQDMTQDAHLSRNKCHTPVQMGESTGNTSGIGTGSISAEHCYHIKGQPAEAGVIKGAVGGDLCLPEMAIQRTAYKFDQTTGKPVLEDWVPDKDCGKRDPPNCSTLGDEQKEWAKYRFADAICWRDEECDTNAICLKDGTDQATAFEKLSDDLKSDLAAAKTHNNGGICMGLMADYQKGCTTSNMCASKRCGEQIIKGLDGKQKSLGNWCCPSGDIDTSASISHESKGIYNMCTNLVDNKTCGDDRQCISGICNSPDVTDGTTPNTCIPPKKWGQEPVSDIGNDSCLTKMSAYMNNTTTKRCCNSLNSVTTVSGAGGTYPSTAGENPGTQYCSDQALCENPNENPYNQSHVTPERMNTCAKTMPQTWCTEDWQCEGNDRCGRDSDKVKNCQNVCAKESDGAGAVGVCYNKGLPLPPCNIPVLGLPGYVRGVFSDDPLNPDAQKPENWKLCECKQDMGYDNGKRGRWTKDTSADASGSGVKNDGNNMCCPGGFSLNYQPSSTRQIDNESWCTNLNNGLVCSYHSQCKSGWCAPVDMMGNLTEFNICRPMCGGLDPVTGYNWAPDPWACDNPLNMAQGVGGCPSCTGLTNNPGAGPIIWPFSGCYDGCGAFAWFDKQNAGYSFVDIEAGTIGGIQVAAPISPAGLRASKWQSGMCCHLGDKAYNQGSCTNRDPGVGGGCAGSLDAGIPQTQYGHVPAYGGTQTSGWLADYHNLSNNKNCPVGANFINPAAGTRRKDGQEVDPKDCIGEGADSLLSNLKSKELTFDTGS